MLYGKNAVRDTMFKNFVRDKHTKYRNPIQLAAQFHAY